MRIPRVEVRQQDGAVLASFQEPTDVDITQAVELGDMLLEAVPNQATGLVLDLTSVRYLDSAGVRMLFRLARQLVTSRQGLALCVPVGSPLIRLLEITKLEEVAIVCSRVEDCIDRVADGGDHGPAIG